MTYSFSSSADFYLSPWESRLILTKQLLTMADRFTHNNLKIGLYLTDWNPDNFAVDKDLQIRIVDAENFILVDQKHLEEVRSPGWNVEHSTDGFGCKDRFCYSSEDLCTHVRSDHNVFGLCKVRSIKYLSTYLGNIPLFLTFSLGIACPGFLLGIDAQRSLTFHPRRCPT